MTMTENQPLSGKHLLGLRVRRGKNARAEIVLVIGDSETIIPPELAIHIGRQFMTAGFDAQEQNRFKT